MRIEFDQPADRRALSRRIRTPADGAAPGGAGEKWSCAEAGQRAAKETRGNLQGFGDLRKSTDRVRLRVDSEGSSNPAVQPEEGKIPDGTEASYDIAGLAPFLLARRTRPACSLPRWLLDMAAILDRGDENLRRKTAREIKALGMEGRLRLACAIVQAVHPVTIPAAFAEIIAGEKSPRAGAARFALARLRLGGKDLAAIRDILADSSIYMPAFVGKPLHKVTLLFHPFPTRGLGIETPHQPKIIEFPHSPQGSSRRTVFELSRRTRSRFGQGAPYAD